MVNMLAYLIDSQRQATKDVRIILQGQIWPTSASPSLGVEECQILDLDYLITVEKLQYMHGYLPIQDEDEARRLLWATYTTVSFLHDPSKDTVYGGGGSWFRARGPCVALFVMCRRQ